MVIPYINHKLSVEGYDCTLYPPLETTPRRLAIIKRNEWMVEQFDIVVAYVTHNWGGAAATLNYANRKRKKVINYTTRGEFDSYYKTNTITYWQGQVHPLSIGQND